MPEAKISYDDVVAAIGALQARNEPINPFRLRVVLGRGAYKTIEKHLKQYQAATMEAARPPPSEKIAGLWAAALSEARQQLDDERAQLFALLEEREAHVAAVESAMQEEAQRRQMAEQRLQDADVERQRLLGQLDEERRQREAAERAVDVAWGDLTAARLQFAEDLQALRAEHGRAQQSIVDQMQARQSELVESLEHGTQQLQRNLVETREYYARALEGATLPLQRGLEASQAQTTSLEICVRGLAEQLGKMDRQRLEQKVRERKARAVRPRPGLRGSRR